MLNFLDVTWSIVVHVYVVIRVKQPLTSSFNVPIPSINASNFSIQYMTLAIQEIELLLISFYVGQG
jgi:hypothetical protein